MIPIKLDISEIVDEFALTGNQSQQLGAEIINRVISEYTSKWEDVVNKGLQSTRSLYKRSMYVDRVSETEVVFGLKEGENGLALSIEEGKPPYDIKPFFKNSSKKKEKIGGGWYLTIPFRHATSQAVAESSLFQSVLPKEIQNIAKRNGGSGISKTQLPSQYAQVATRNKITLPNGQNIAAYTHKSPIYQGLVRLNISSTDNENRGGYFTFRRVSDKSDPLSWIHKGFEAKKFMDKALQEADISTVADMAIDEFLNQIL